MHCMKAAPSTLICAPPFTFHLQTQPHRETHTCILSFQYLELQQIPTATHTYVLSHEHTQGLHKGPGGIQYLELQQIPTATHTHVLLHADTHRDSTRVPAASSILSCSRSRTPPSGRKRDTEDEKERTKDRRHDDEEGGEEDEEDDEEDKIALMVMVMAMLMMRSRTTAMMTRSSPVHYVHGEVAEQATSNEQAPVPPPITMFVLI